MMTIFYSTGTSSLGDFFFAVSENGLVMFEPGVSLSTGEVRLKDRYPGADLIRDDDRLQYLSGQLGNVIDTPSTAADIPVVLSGSPFEHRVWTLLQTIPAGKRVSYGELAEKIGEPGEAQKVAKACAANTIAILIPCHRVVKKDGTLSGYRWGYWRKKALLERELAYQHAQDFTLEE
ncbi:methylated-DNA--[protein]-cysteine S-methyltransferase [Photorhabdus viridis]|uniref:methylated-DNA--[protein]-cysteine S-methyltransferase n=1 Tax=Photorhabdus viridis TaxID=3163327 RepID=UPI003306C19F